MTSPLSVSSSQPKLRHERLARTERRLPLRVHFRTVVETNSLEPRSRRNLGFTGVVEPSLIEILWRSIRRCCPDDVGYRLGQNTEVRLALSEIMGQLFHTR